MLENQTSPPCQLLKDPLAPHLHHASAEGIYVKLFHRAKMTAHLKGQGVRPVAMDFISCSKVLQFHREHISFFSKRSWHFASAFYVIKYVIIFTLWNK